MKKYSIISPEIKEVLKLPDKTEKLRELFKDMLPRDSYVLAEGLEPEEIAEIIIALGQEKGSKLLEEFPVNEQRDIFTDLPYLLQKGILEKLPTDEQIDLVKNIPKKLASKLLSVIPSADRKDIKKFIGYAEDTAGAVLTTEYASVPADVTAEKALLLVRDQAFNRETIYYVYVLNNDKKLLGFLSLKDILVSPPDKIVSEIMHTEVITSNVNDDREHVARKIANYDFLAIPVVDNENHMLGIVTVDDVIDVIKEEHTEDFLRHGAAGDLFDYAGSSPAHVAKHRILWLLILVVMGFVSGTVMQKYEAQLQAVVALAFFIPLLCDSGGNAGTQSSTIVIRGLATGEVKIKDVFKIFQKEFFTGVIVGGAMGILGAVRAIFMNKDPLLALTVGIAMIATVIVATTLGAILPFIFKKMKLDPALMSGPFITSIVDIVSLFVYLQCAVWIFN